MFKKIRLLEDPVLILYFITATILLLDVTNNFPMIETLRKIKYPLFFIMFCDALRERKFIIGYKSLLVLLCFYVHTILFGLVYVNPQVADLTFIHFREMLVYLVYLTLTIEMLSRKKCHIEYLEGMCIVFAIFFLWTGSTHLADFVNPLYYPMVLMRVGRIRSNFGTASPNYIGYYAFVALIFYYMLWWTWKQNGRINKGKTQLLTIISIWTVCMLFSTASRSSILSFAIFVLCCFILQYPKFTPATRKLIAVTVLVVVIAVLALNWQSIWSNSNRSDNITINMPIFEELDARMTGMGYIESSGFYADSYGYDTWPVDIYYLYIFLSTGIVGCVLIIIPLISILFYYLLKRNKNTMQKILLAAYIALLFNGFWQVNLFTYRFIATLFINSILLYFMGNHTDIVGAKHE